MDSKSDKVDLLNNSGAENNLITNERFSISGSKKNKDEFIIQKNISNINNKNKLHLNGIIKPKNKSEKYKTNSNLLKFYNDINEAKSSKHNFNKKHSIEMITKLKRLSFQPEEEKIKENAQNPINNNNNFNNMPSFTKELRRALYSNSDIQSVKSVHSSSGNHSCNSANHSFNQNNYESIHFLEKISEEHMHEDNQTLLQVIMERRNINTFNIENKNKIKCKICKEEKNKNNIIKEEDDDDNINNYNNDLLVMISTTKEEVEKIQSKVESVKKINQSFSCNQCTKRMKINDSNISQDNISYYLQKEKNKKYSIDKSNNLKKHLQEKNAETPQKIQENKKMGNNIDTSISIFQYNPYNALSFPIIMVASSLMKDIRDIYKFKEKPLGGGNFGTVRKAYRREEKNKRQYYAIKSISKKNLDEKDFEGLVKEVDIISSLDHPNIIKFYETYHDKFYFHLVMELCKGRDSFNQIVIIEKCEEKKVVSLIAKVLLAIAHCHSRGITHRDLKPENILYENNEPDAEIKIIDFGLSRKYAKDEKMHSVLGTPYYVAPEVLKGNYNEKCDIWSIGAMTYLLLCGEYPFNGGSDKEIFDDILNSNVHFNSIKWNKISNNAKSFVKSCLEKNPDKRPSAIKALDHPWFANVLNETHKVENLRGGILLNIKNFKIKEKFKQMIMKYLLNTMEEKELKIYKSAFFAIDFFHNGCVEQPELKKAFELKEISITDEEISHLYKILDQNLKGAMDYTEFLMAGVNQKNLFTTEKLTKAFNYFDINKSGFIENSDLYDSLLRMGRECININDVNSFIYEVLKNIDDNKESDKNSDIFTKVSYEDFLKIFQNDQTNNFSP